MSRFDTYFLMQDCDLPDYIREKYPSIFPASAKLEAKEFGDGNINYVFRVRDSVTGQTVIVKQAGEYNRYPPLFRVETDRNRLESEALELFSGYAPEYVPRIYGYDDVMCACVMEDLRQYQVMRGAMVAHCIFPGFAEQISSFLVSALFPTSDLMEDHVAKKNLMKRFINPHMCDITEKLVLTEPCDDYRKQNMVEPAIADFVKNELYEDKALVLAVARLKFSFMNKSQALLHGDLHSGSIFINQNSLKVFDAEFAFFGPIGYDVGNVIANLIFAWGNGKANQAAAFSDWVLDAVRDTVDLFCRKAAAFIDDRATERSVRAPGFKEYYLADLLQDTASYTGTELLRRMVGRSPIKDVESIQDDKIRAGVKRANIRCGKEMILQAQNFRCGQDFVTAVVSAYEKELFSRGL